MKARTRTLKRAKPAKVDFNHVLLYVEDVTRSRTFYESLGLELVEDTEDYARLRAPGGSGTVAVHAAHGRSTQSSGMRIYLEVPDLERYCDQLVAKGVKFDQPPRMMEWGWKHAYLKDPDGHEISPYYAGLERVRPKATR